MWAMMFYYEGGGDKGLDVAVEGGTTRGTTALVY
jgi:hypothetical protein